MPRKVLVTGGAGFIGSHLVDRLVTRGYEIYVLDNLSTGKLDNLAGHLNNEKVHFVKGDIRNAELVEKLVGEVDYIVHSAALISVPFSIEKPMVTTEVNFNGTLNLLKASVNSNIERFIFISSCAVYGEARYLPIDEGHPPSPLSPYAASKLAAENYCTAFHNTYCLKTVILRLFNVYGPRQDFNQYSGVITQFRQRIRKKLPPVIFGDGTQTRDFIHVSDVTEAISKALEAPRVDGETFNIGSGTAIKIAELAKLMLRLASLDLSIEYDAPRPGDIKNSYADIAKAGKLLNFKPKISLSAGLEALLKADA
jgi:UDP-glucose 4-epimerase